MTTLADISNGVQSSPADENSKPNAFVSALAGIGSGELLFQYGKVIILIILE